MPSAPALLELCERCIPWGTVMTDELPVGSIAIEVDTGRLLRVLSPSRLAAAPPTELAYAERRGLSLRTARVALGWNAPPPMWGPGAVDAPTLTEVLVVGLRGEPFWCDRSLLMLYRDWYRQHAGGPVSRAVALELLGLAGQLELLDLLEQLDPHPG
jgi:hypothetical protein